MNEVNYHSHEEICSQNTSLERTMNYILENSAIIKNFLKDKDYEDIVFIASGSSYWLSLSAHKTMHLFTGKKAFAVKAGDVILCPEEHIKLYKNPIFFCPSRSGRTKELLDALDILQKAYPNARILSITEYPDNELLQRSDLALTIEWANETSVCQTRSFSSLYLAFVMIAAVVGEKDYFIEQLKDYLRKTSELYLKHEKLISSIADPETITSLVTLGTGLQYGVVIEGAYIVIEMAEFACNYFQLLEYRHGPIVTADKGTAVFICSDNKSFDIEEKMAKEIRSAGGKVYSIANSNMDWADITFSLEGDYCKEILALHFVFVLQLLAYYFSIKRGKNPDSPGNLVPYIEY